MRGDAECARPLAIVVGSGDVGSAIAVALHRAGCGVVVCDGVDPSWPRRGMAFTNAWYVGNAELDGEGAVFCASVKSIPSLVDRRRVIAATTWSWPGVAAALQPIAVVDATLRTRTERGLTPPGAHGDALMITIAATIGYETCADVVIDFAGREGASLQGNVVRASQSGRFGTRRRIGDRVLEGEIVAAVGAVAVRAPRTGVLRGLSAHGARIAENAEILEIDPRGDPVLCYGIEAGPRAAGSEVLRTLALRGLLSAADAVADPVTRVRSEAGRSSPYRPAAR